MNVASLSKYSRPASTRQLSGSQRAGDLSARAWPSATRMRDAHSPTLSPETLHGDARFGTLMYANGSRPDTAPQRFYRFGHIADGFLLLLCLIATPIQATAQEGADCFHADITEDGQLVVLRPGCEISGGYDLVRQVPLSRPKTLEALGGRRVIPLERAESKGSFGRWLQRHWEREVDEYQWSAFRLPSSQWLLRVKSRSADGVPHKVHRRTVQLAPEPVFRQMHKKRARKLPQLVEAFSPVTPLATASPTDLSGVFTIMSDSRERGKSITRIVHYSPKAYAKAVPGFGDLLRHARMSWHGEGSPDGSSGWHLSELAPKGFWLSVGLTKPGFRIVNWRKRLPSASLRRMHEALQRGEEVKLRTYRPFLWTVLQFKPKH